MRIRLGHLSELHEDISMDLQEITLKMVTKEDLKNELEKYATKEDLKEMEQRVTSKLMSRETGEELLEYMKSIDQQLKNWRDIPATVRELPGGTKYHRPSENQAGGKK